MAATKDLEHGFEIEQYVQALRESSSHVRFVMLALIIATVASAATLWSERDGAWAEARLVRAAKNYYIAKSCGLWENFNYTAECPAKSTRPSKRLRSQPKVQKNLVKDLFWSGKPIDCSEICDTADWFSHYGIDTEAAANIFAEKQREAYINNILYVKTPVLGLAFDINDLGLITGITLVILMIVMVFYTHRAHENLVLATWKLQEITEKESCFDQPGSKANLLYHALAMQQVFTIPPTLARWGDFKPFRRAHYLLFFFPPLVQFLVLCNDLKSVRLGSLVSVIQTALSMLWQFAFLAAIVPLCILCWAHFHADDVEWDRIFLLINPSYRFKEKARWAHWVHFARNKTPGWGLAVRDTEGAKHLYFSDTVCDKIWRVEISESRAKICKFKSTRARGLYLEGGHAQVYSFGAMRHPGYERLIKDDDLLSWEKEKGKQEADSPFEVFSDPTSSNKERFLFSSKNIKKYHSADVLAWEAGGEKHQKDGWGANAGFDSIRALLCDGDSLFVTDGAWVRKISAYGEVRTWGGKPLGRVVRQERPLLLGMALLNGRSVIRQVSCDNEPRLLPDLLVCDFSLRRVLGVWEDRVEEVYRSEWGWSPSGVYIDADSIYLLEYKYETASVEVLNLIRRSCQSRMVLRWLLRPFEGTEEASHIRVICFSNLDFHGVPVVIEAVWQGRSPHIANCQPVDAC